MASIPQTDPGKKLNAGHSSVKVRVTETVTTRNGKKKV
jgi:hypothetical protein